MDGGCGLILDGGGPEGGAGEVCGGGGGEGVFEDEGELVEEVRGGCGSGWVEGGDKGDESSVGSYELLEGGPCLKGGGGGWGGVRIGGYLCGTELGVEVLG